MCAGICLVFLVGMGIAIERFLRDGVPLPSFFWPLACVGILIIVGMIVGSRHSGSKHKNRSTSRSVGKVDTSYINEASSSPSSTVRVGNIYDDRGRYIGRTGDDGSTYDDRGRYTGRIGSDGSSYDSRGRCTGRVGSDGSIYDNRGRYTGRIDAEGNTYDDGGRYTGRIKN